MPVDSAERAASVVVTWLAAISLVECTRDFPAAVTDSILPEMDSAAIGLAIALARSAAIPAWILPPGAVVISTFDDVATSSPIASAPSVGMTTLRLVGGAIVEAGARLGDGAGVWATTIPGCGVRGTTMITDSIATTIVSGP